IKNGAPQLLAVTISGGATSGSNIVNTVPVAEGDYVTLLCHPDSTPTAVRAYWGFTFVTDEIGFFPILGGTEFPVDAAATEYNYVGSRGVDWTGVEANFYRCIQKCKLSNLYVKLDAAPGAGDAHILALRRNGATTLLSVTISGAVDTTGQDTTNEIEVVDDDLINVISTHTGTPVERDCAWSLRGKAGIDSTLHLKLGLGGYGNQGGRLKRIPVWHRVHNRLH
ncbi:unnamed protein product, partial [marine sediment metagenome]